MNEFLKKNLIVLIAFALPVILIIVVALSVYLPSLFVRTDYNFVYAICTDSSYYYGNECSNFLQKKYTVVNGKIITNDVDLSVDVYGNKRPGAGTFNSRVFLHNTKTNESRELGSSEETQIILNSNLYTSPDGVTISRDSSGGDYFMFPFGGSSYTSGWYLTKGGSKKKMNLINDNDRYYYQDSLVVLGWVK